VVGVVEDANRAAVAGAKVTLVEVQTNVTRGRRRALTPRWRRRA
jgi:hypothetical protein